ncbi:MAG: hypothetical protein BroJett033_1940 [Chloroflexota bacterium]|nr:MAG: hypothetical protein BroJett033_1940 [Chloroflexota bacterium]
MAREAVVAVFPSRAFLAKALDRIMELEDMKVTDAAIVVRAKDGEVIVLDDDISPDEGAIAGGTLGAAISALGLVQLGALALPGIGPIIALGTAVLAGGLVGGGVGRVVAGLIDFDYKRYAVQPLAAYLQSDHPALVLEIESETQTLPLLKKELAVYRAEVVEYLDQVPSLMDKTARSG